MFGGDECVGGVIGVRALFLVQCDLVCVFDYSFRHLFVLWVYGGAVPGNEGSTAAGEAPRSVQQGPNPGATWHYYTLQDFTPVDGAAPYVG